MATPNFSVEIRRFSSSLPRIIANVAKNHFLEGFRKGGGQTNKSIGGWAPRKKADKNKRRRGILINTGKLRRSIDIRNITPARIVIGSEGVPYAEYINEGTARMTQREFIGDSRELEQQIIKEIDKQFNRAIR